MEVLSDTVKYLREIFAAEGVPTIVMSDNGPSVKSVEFQNFAHAFDFMHIISFPPFHQSNGFIKAMVKKSRMHTGRLMVPPMPWYEFYFSYMRYTSLS